jgi:thiamine-phosphate pyrophosphorylase
MCRHPWRTVVEQALEGGADVLQLREKSLGDRELLQRATWVRDACRSAGALFVMNDRPDLAVAVQADAVHVGQEELSVAQSRKILGRDQLVGVSTHDAEQAQRAFEDGADYIGVGPVFPSKTKSFDAFPGLEFVRQVAAASSKPWFAIGGISLENIDPLIQAGARRVAVTSVVAASDEPAQVVREFRRRLQSV